MRIGSVVSTPLPKTWVLSFPTYFSRSSVSQHGARTGGTFRPGPVGDFHGLDVYFDEGLGFNEIGEKVRDIKADILRLSEEIT